MVSLSGIHCTSLWKSGALKVALLSDAYTVLNPAERDRWEMRASIRLAREIFTQPAFDRFRAGELEPGLEATTDAQLDAVVRAKADSAYHPSCTCKMGDPNADDSVVVDSRSMEVVGTENLHVVDASVMPSIVSGNLNAPTIMLAEKAADIIRGKKPLAELKVPVYQSL